MRLCISLLKVEEKVMVIVRKSDKYKVLPILNLGYEHAI